MVLDADGRAHSVDVAVLAPAARAFRSEQVHGASVGHRRQVGAQRAAPWVELVGVAPQPDEHLLSDVLCCGAVVEHAVGDPGDP